MKTRIALRRVTQVLLWLSFVPAAVGVLLASASNLLCAERLPAGNRLADELVGTWQSAVIDTKTEEFGTVRAEIMFGKNGVVVSTLVDAGRPNGRVLDSDAARYKIVGDKLVCEPEMDDEETTKIRIDGNSLELQTKDETKRFTRKSKEESVAAYLDGLIADLKASDRDTSWKALQIIRYIGPEARKAIPQLCAIIRDRSNRDSSPQQLALDALINMGPEEKAILPFVIGELNDRENRILAGMAAEGLVRSERGPRRLCRHLSTC